MYSDSANTAQAMGALSANVSLALFPEMSNDEYFFAMAQEGELCDRYGWVPTASVQLVDPRFGDVPRNHWAGEALRRLEREGIIEGNRGGFHGEESVTRYEMAMVLDRHLDKLKEYKASVMAAIEAIPYDRTLDGSEAGKLDMLIQHLEGIELTEKQLRCDVSDLRSRVRNNSTRLNVVEEATALHAETLEGLKSQMARVDGGIDRVDSFAEKLERMEQRMDSFDQRLQSKQELPWQSQDLNELREELQKLRKKVEGLEAPAMAAAPSEKVPEQEEDRASEDASFDDFVEEDFAFMAENFDMESEVEEEIGFEEEEGPDKLQKKAERAHDALRAALRKKLIIKRHPMAGSKGNELAAKQSNGGGEKKVLVKALTKQISDISNSLQTIDHRINDIEHGMLD